MPAVALELVEGCQRLRGARDDLGDRDVTEVVGGQIRQQRHAYVCWGGSMSSALWGIFLKIVGGKIIILRADEGLKKTPGAPSDASKKHKIVRHQAGLANLDRLAQPECNGWRRQPETDHGRCNGE